MKNLNVNADFLLDIWADVKEKRLAPVAIGLGVALIAMPALLLKGEETPSAGPVPIVAAPASAGGAEVELAEELADGDSKLDSYKSRDPFDGLVKPDKDDGPSTSGTAIAPSDLMAAAAGKGASGAPSTGSTGGSVPPLDLGGSNGSGGSGGLTTPGDSPVVVKRPPTGFNYQLDVKFGRPGSEKRYPSLARMSFLPSEKLPALLFMGVPEEAKSAIFFVHPTLSHAGEGICIPNPNKCTFLELKIGRDHFLSVNDYEFRIHLLGIKKVKVKATGQDSGTRKTTGNRRSSRTADDGSGSADRELPPLLDGMG